MTFDPRCLVIDRAHLGKLRGEAALKAIARELEEFEQSDTAQAIVVLVSPAGIMRSLITDVELPRTEPPRVTALCAFIELALERYIPPGRVAWMLFLDEPAKSGVWDWLHLQGSVISETWH